MSSKDQIENNLNKQTANELNNIEYNTSDSEGNTFYISAKNALIKLDDNNNPVNKIDLQEIGRAHV